MPSMTDSVFGIFLRVSIPQIRGAFPSLKDSSFILTASKSLLKASPCIDVTFKVRHDQVRLIPSTSMITSCGCRTILTQIVRYVGSNCKADIYCFRSSAIAAELPPQNNKIKIGRKIHYENLHSQLDNVCILPHNTCTA